MATANSTESDLGQTVVVPAAGNERAAHNAGHKPVAVVAGSEADFSHETNNILRDRLRQASLILFCGYLAFLIKAFVAPSKNFMEGNSFYIVMLAGVTAIMGLVAWRLCSKCHYFLGHLRGVEYLVFGSSAVLFVTFGYTTLLYTAGQGYLVPLTPPWLILIFTYALFIPNNWRRAAVIMTIMAVCPLLTILVAWGSSEKVADLIENTSDFHHVFLETVMAMAFGTAVAISGVRLIRTLRTQAFEAQQLGQYKLKRLLGRGGMGEVYLAEHLMLKRPCAIKLIRPEKAGDPATLARFEQEVQSTAKLTHWNTVEIYDFGRTDDGTFYYVMEYLPGMSLDQIVDMHGPLPASRIIHLLAQTCDALAEAHAHGMVHRDIKPANIFAAKRGGAYDVAKLLDFGLVRSVHQENDLHLTQDGMVTGSPLYMSPEQARGDDVDARSDIYALGCVAYFLLTGRPPFNETRPIKLVLAHVQDIAERPSTLRADVPADLESIILRCLEKSPDDRFANVLALRDALMECQDAGDWNRDAALEWWQCHGCPKKRELDTCISQGIEMRPESSDAHEVSSAELMKA
ncbi:serine/threonine-protein kinase [Planctomicrobium piriforme]|uniref:non-specific serine/threonine protein kinase n=1 Tax=Planctomicrobium piriforme TaxID=1576369 RepID=A0A1I3QKG1_9PLAN|nr:serine/threonine-protein kinase [Planctomicrobium piriforme]SFJ34245.1 serine/threonine protein kinase [Planctomicrobium piriforme]